MSERTRNIHSEEEECVMVNGRGADRLRRWSVREAARRSAGRLSQSLARDNDERYPGLKVKKKSLRCGSSGGHHHHDFTKSRSEPAARSTPASRWGCPPAGGTAKTTVFIDSGMIWYVDCSRQSDIQVGYCLRGGCAGPVRRLPFLGSLLRSGGL